jgi:opacity protein-like surface antigen
MMKKTIAMVVAAASLAQACVTAASAADMVRTYEEPDTRGGVKIGMLTCDIGGGLGYVLGSAKEADCVFSSTIGNEVTDHYTGDIRKLGIDLGFTTRSRLVWAVFAPTAGYHRGSLGGLYVGASAEATVGAGVGANVLIGGTSGSIHLQALSVTGQLGLNVAAGSASMTLTPG